MKLITKKEREWRPGPFPCAQVYTKITFFFVGIKFKTKLIRKR